MKKHALIVFALVLCPAFAFATASPELMKQVSDQVGAIQDSLDTPGDTSGDSSGDSLSCTVASVGGESAWFFKNIWIRLTVPTGFTVPGVAGVSAIPTFEMLVQRPVPAGWQVYQPPTSAEVSAVTPD